MNRQILLLILELCVVGMAIGGCRSLPSYIQSADEPVGIVWKTLQEWDYVPAGERVVGVLIYDSNDLNSSAGLLIGDRQQIEDLIGRNVNPSIICNNQRAVEEFSYLYARALREGKANHLGSLMGTQGVVVFLTGQGAYVREIGYGEGIVCDAWMISPELAHFFREWGLESDEPNIPPKGRGALPAPVGENLWREPGEK